ncbi:MAG: DUF4158 domain-containing protein, partial [Blastocatellia bacterium]
MAAAHETAYPRLKHSVSEKELQESYTPSAADLALAADFVKGTGPRICFLILLKTFERLGYFVQLHDVPKPIAEHISLLFGVHHGAIEWEAYDQSGTRRRHVILIREHLNVCPFDASAQSIAEAVFKSVARTREDLADLINAAIEELIRRRYELPAFRTLLDTARRIRAEVNRHFFQTVWAALGERHLKVIDDLLLTDGVNRRSLWQNIKLDTGAPTLKEFRQLVERLKWLTSPDLHKRELLSTIPPVKVRHFAKEAASLDAARMLELDDEKCSTLVAALVQRQIARCLDDLGEMIIRRMRRSHARARQALADYLWEHQPDTDQLIGVLFELLQAWQETVDPQSRVAALDELIGDRIEALLSACQAHRVHAHRNYLPFLWQLYYSHRKMLFRILSEIDLRSTLPDDSLKESISFLLTKRRSRKKSISLPLRKADVAAGLSLRWIPDKWWTPITGREGRNVVITEVDRRYFEMCLFTEVA